MFSVISTIFVQLFLIFFIIFFIIVTFVIHFVFSIISIRVLFCQRFFIFLKLRIDRRFCPII
ncbi:unnamed protein product [Meloidogyne enterolobii]|uniref:Uncharacterized protein n=1 Tax=Meloidogyne enterolobii TaxID=390850 RepID=A0ACB0YC40_MELEN